MYLWIGCKLSGDFSEYIRRQCMTIGSSAMDYSGFTLPQHISLKISFDTGSSHEEILEYTTALLQTQKPFTVHPNAVEGYGSILWVSFQETQHLTQLHDLLDRQLKNRFFIPQHPYDQCFLFHSTLCMGTEEAVSNMAQKFRDLTIPDSLVIDTFLLGISETGKSGSYRVIREIHL